MCHSSNRQAIDFALGTQRCRFAFWTNAEDVSEQHPNPAWIAVTDSRLHRAGLLKEGPRTGFQVPYYDADEAPGPLPWKGEGLTLPAVAKLTNASKRPAT